MKSIYKIAAVAALAFASASCDDLFEPAFEPSQDINSTEDFPKYADGLLYDAYLLMPYSTGVNSDLATDDAVSNDNSNAYLKVATGSWTANNGTMSYWKSGRGGIQFVNLLLSKVDDVNFSANDRVQQLFLDRLKGEAYGMRALFMYHLLRQHGGWAGGELLGLPVLLEPETASSDFNQPRATFKACVQQIFDDVQLATSLLPTDYKDITSESEIPAKYRELGVSLDEYIRVCGADFNGRMSGRVAQVIAPQTPLLAASPAFSAGSGVEWAEAADRAAAVLDLNNGAAGLYDQGHLYYTGDEVKKLTSGANREVIWRDNISPSNSLEKDNFPPSLRGTGRVNPTQNLVDAFPDAAGYPITDSHATYDLQNPYANRDPRLALYIVVNGSKWGHNDTEIISGVYGSNNDALNAEQGHSTRCASSSPSSATSTPPSTPSRITPTCACATPSSTSTTPRPPTRHGAPPAAAHTATAPTTSSRPSASAPASAQAARTPTSRASRAARTRCASSSATNAASSSASRTCASGTCAAGRPTSTRPHAACASPTTAAPCTTRSSTSRTATIMTT